jgi:MoxR-like ATPase
MAHLSQPAFANLTGLREDAKREMSKVVVGQEKAVELLLVAAIARGHVLLEGPPGSAKTLMGRAMAHVLGASFRRVQFTPDTTPDMLTGHYVNRGGEKVFMQGAVFTNIMLADEINRTPPRTQSALLEAMGERTVTVDGETHRLPDPFLVIATQNPFEHEGIYPLPESQLDRFLFKVELDYCGPEDEVEMLKLPHTGVTPDMLGEIKPLLGLVGLDKARQELDTTIVSDKAARYVIGLVRSTRDMDGVILGASSRSAIHLMSAAKATARLNGRNAVTIEDIREIAPNVLKHRLICEGVTAESVLEQALARAVAV